MSHPPPPCGPARLVAIYIDLENLHASTLDALEGRGAYRERLAEAQRALVHLGPILEAGAVAGFVAIKKAYADWSHLRCYRREVLAHAVEPIQVFQLGQHAKNGADIRLGCDVVSDLHRLPGITHVVIAGGDSDYVAVAQKCRELGKVVIGVGVPGSTSKHWVAACDQFIPCGPAPGLPPREAHREAPATVASLKTLVHQAIATLVAETGQIAIVQAALKPALLRLDPGFTPERYGLRSIAEVLSACADVVHVTRNGSDNLLSLLEPCGPAEPASPCAPFPPQPPEVP